MTNYKKIKRKDYDAFVEKFKPKKQLMIVIHRLRFMKRLKIGCAKNMTSIPNT